jgi:hypothetical protein
VISIYMYDKDAVVAMVVICKAFVGGPSKICLHSCFERRFGRKTQSDEPTSTRIACDELSNPIKKVLHIIVFSQRVGANDRASILPSLLGAGADLPRSRVPAPSREAAETTATRASRDYDVRIYTDGSSHRRSRWLFK